MTVEQENAELANLPSVSFEDLGIPFHPIPAAASDDAIVKLTLCRSGELNITANYFLRDRSEPLFIPDHTFLIEKKLPDGSIYRVVWDLGLRPEFKKESYVFLFKLFNSVCRANVPQLLEEGAGIDPHSINAAVISHMHFDHLGDISAFPSSTELILGPKATTNIKEQADLLDVDEADLRARKVRVLSKETDTWTNVGPFEAIDYFKDGSFFILSSPGHTHHHISALVRVSKDKYFLLGSDTCHHCGFIHSATPLQFGMFKWDDTEKLHVMMEDPETAYKSIAKTRRMEQEPNVVVWIAHDSSIDALIEPGKEVVPIDPSWFDKLKSRKITL